MSKALGASRLSKLRTSRGYRFYVWPTNAQCRWGKQFTCKRWWRCC